MDRTDTMDSILKRTKPAQPLDFWWGSLTNGAMQPFRGGDALLGSLVGLPTAASCRLWGAAQGKGGKQRAPGCCLAHNPGSKATWRVCQSSPSGCSSWHQAPQAVRALCPNSEQLGTSIVHQIFCLPRREMHVEFLRAVVYMGLICAPGSIRCLYVCLSIYSLPKN